MLPARSLNWACTILVPSPDGRVIGTVPPAGVQLAGQASPPLRTRMTTAPLVSIAQVSTVVAWVSIA